MSRLSCKAVLAVLCLGGTVQTALGGEWVFVRTSSETEATSLIYVVANGLPPTDPPDDAGDTDTESSDSAEPLIVTTSAMAAAGSDSVTAFGSAFAYFGADEEDIATLDIKGGAGIIAVGSIYGDFSGYALGESTMEIAEVQSGGTFSLRATIRLSYQWDNSADGTYGFEDNTYAFGRIWLDDDLSNGISIGTSAGMEEVYSAIDPTEDEDTTAVIHDETLSYYVDVTYTWTGLSSSDLPVVHFDGSTGGGGEVDGGITDFFGNNDLYSGTRLEFKVEILPD